MLCPPDPNPSDGFVFPQQAPYVGTDAADHLVDYLLEAADRIHDKLFLPPPLHMTPEDTARYESEDECHICIKKHAALKHIQHAHRPEDMIHDEHGNISSPPWCGDCRINDKLAERGFADEFIKHVHAKGTTEKEKAKC